MAFGKALLILDLDGSNTALELQLDISLKWPEERFCCQSDLLSRPPVWFLLVNTAPGSLLFNSNEDRECRHQLTLLVRTVSRFFLQLVDFRELCQLFIPQRRVA